MAADVGLEAPVLPRKTLDEIRREIDAEYPPIVPEFAVEAASPTEASGWRRKTLDEIRREIDEEYFPVLPEFAGEAARTSAEDERSQPALVGADDLPTAIIRRKRPLRRVLGYLVVGAIGYIAGRVLPIANVAMPPYALNVSGSPATAQRSLPPARPERDRAVSGKPTTIARDAGPRSRVVNPSRLSRRPPLTPSSTMTSTSQRPDLDAAQDQSASTPVIATRAANPGRIAAQEEVPQFLSPPSVSDARQPPGLARLVDWVVSQAQRRTVDPSLLSVGVAEGRGTGVLAP